jgi:hypothetical protein
MAYDMNAEGVNGVQQTTYLVYNSSGGGWIEPPPMANGSVLLFVNAQGFPNPTLAGVQALGNHGAPGLVGQVTHFIVGPLPGVGVAGYNVLGPGKIDGTYSFTRSLQETAGVYGECDGGPGVKGKGGNAITNPVDEPGSLPFPGGIGVLGVGGESAAASKKIPHEPAGAGVVGLAGGASAPSDTSATGVIGMGSPAGNGFDAGRGGVFGSAGNCAQVQLVPPTQPVGQSGPLALDLPEQGRFGDLYVTLAGGVPTLFFCILPGAKGSPAGPPFWAPIIMGPQQEGGTSPVPGKTYP